MNWMRFTMMAALLCGLLIGGCSDKESKNPSREHLSPGAIDLAGIRFSLTKGEFQSRFPSMRCRSGDGDLEICVMSPRGSPDEDSFQGIEQINLQFFRDTLHTIQLEYGQMFDVEYRKFEAGVREKYARVPDDTTSFDWTYDSLRVTLTPNPRRHWTGSVATNNPLLEFQERTRYQSWIEGLRQRQIRRIY